MSLIIGLTGGIASGKSTVSEMLKEMKIPVIDADIEARNVVVKGQKAYEQIVTEFGNEILTENGDIDRTRLGSIVFSDEQKRMQLNAIVHPAVRERMMIEKEKAIKDGNEVVVLDIPLLFESKLTHMVEKTILVYVDEEIQLQRLMLRNQLTEHEALDRIHSQISLKNKVKLADEVINNNGSLVKTHEQLVKILTKWNTKKMA